MTYDPNKEIINRYVKILDERIKAAEELIAERQIERNILVRQRLTLNSITKETAMKAKDHISPDAPTDEDMSMVRVPWTLLAAIDASLTLAGYEQTVVAKELRKFTDDDADVRKSGTEAFYEDHPQRVPPHAEG